MKIWTNDTVFILTARPPSLDNILGPKLLNLQGTVSKETAVLRKCAANVQNCSSNCSLNYRCV